MNKEFDDIQLEIRKFVAPEYIFGLDSRVYVGLYCQKLGGRKVLLVTDNIILKSPWILEAEGKLKEAEIDYVIFSNVSPNPRNYEVMEGAQMYSQNKCNMILAIGGGSVIDCAKGIGIIANNGGDIRDFEGVDKIYKPMPPLVCIPTTGGTSADVSQFAIINNYEEKYKMAIISKATVPDVALIDPYVLTSMNKHLTACTGIDALSHAFEAFVSNANSAFTDLYALEAIRLLDKNLLSSVQEPNNLQARGKVMLASLYAGLAFSNASLGCIHSMAHSLGGYLDLPHGECNAILLPHVVNYNFDKASDRYKKIAETLQLSSVGINNQENKKSLMNYLFQMNKTLGVDKTLQQKGVTLDIISVLSGKAIQDPCNATNPRPPVKKDLEVIYKEAL
ncbi:iron-containing alcohol dehydrogenase [Labilibaculum sp. A4]|uniref:alcohol dehydrogenase-like regulatory protein ErcA n=1 Tax=Labilibaculum euxinus TaxID=2686357 RepID=UPI000F624229|nr:alcohol dehydrogenase-like regulatory protein ErcA [Labilibaculum euxinus]MDQ1771923.1 alcohol dehydrogenase-like regulatory protein ErcA [Labilibaculum euxinus]MWN75727.1 iron-containing alcohol dehydrogenase [Labilibaculum euxinus]